ncbi:unnamed protein product [Ceutorhynchus assimilis]|uniref:Piezo TM1-24 domain-containing protein n=1 Tax=Ceutorhynchus assimilis TaxID=467358 RepID=A0A9P0GMA9_9CUCU|nr:unnamed protein product [Ceutorhynchus assimilis]
MGCYMPFVSVPTSKTMAGSTGSYLKLLITVCLLMCLMVYSTWFVLFFFTERQYQFEPCSDLEKIIRTVGIIRFANLPVYESIIWCIPEPLMLLVCIFSYFGFKKLTKEVAVVTRRRGEKLKMQAREINRKKLLTILFTVGKWLTCLMLCLTATLKPSAFGAVYYVMFLTLLTNWACDRTLGRVFARILACLIPIIFLNITIMIFYQFQYFHDSELFSTYSIWGRLFHLVDLKTYQDCTDPRIFKFYPHSNATYAVPVCLFVLYQLIILISREILEAKDGILSFLWVFFRCCRRNAVAAKWRQTIRKVRDNLEDRKAMRITTLLMADRVKYFMIQIMQLLMTVTYVFANIVIMVWAISYVTWSSLILLFYANIVWLLPFRRQVMLSTSPFLVFFMVVLLLTAYAYSLDLTREELPTKIGIFDFSILVCNIDSQQKWLTLMTKSLMACVVFASMGQYFRERSLRKLAKTSRKSMFGMTPLMLAVKARLKTSFITRFQNLIFEFLGLWWIWIVTITMIGIEFWTDITLFKMVFVAFVIIFLITFQQNFFQEEFNRITSPVDPEELAEEEEELKKKNSAWTKLVLLFHKIRDVFFAFLEAYLLNLILLIGWYMCLYDMGAVFVPVVMLLICACLFGRKIANPVVHLVSICVQLLIILRMIYMHQYRYHREWDYTGEYIKNGETHNVTLNSADWFGFHQPSKDMYTADFWQLAWCFGYVFSVVMHRIVTIRMANYRFSRELPKPKPIVMFPDVTWKNCHDTTGNLLKFLANYGFYKFGCEVSYGWDYIVIRING